MAWGGRAREQCGSNNHPLRFLSYLGRCGGWAREAGGGEGEMGGTRLVWEQRRVGEGGVEAGGANCCFGA